MEFERPTNEVASRWFVGARNYPRAWDGARPDHGWHGLRKRDRGFVVGDVDAEVFRLRLELCGIEPGKHFFIFGAEAGEAVGIGDDSPPSIRTDGPPRRSRWVGD